MPGNATDQLVDHNFRCTFCNKLITRYLTRQVLGIPAEEDPEPGKLYRYDRCYCGFGRFVICERANISKEELEAELHRKMQH